MIYEPEGEDEDKDANEPEVEDDTKDGFGSDCPIVAMMETDKN